MARTRAQPAALVKRTDLGSYAFCDSLPHFWHGRVGSREAATMATASRQLNTVVTIEGPRVVIDVLLYRAGYVED